MKSFFWNQIVQSFSFAVILEIRKNKMKHENLRKIDIFENNRSILSNILFNPLNNIRKQSSCSGVKILQTAANKSLHSLCNYYWREILESLSFNFNPCMCTQQCTVVLHTYIHANCYPIFCPEKSCLFQWICNPKILSKIGAFYFKI